MRPLLVAACVLVAVASIAQGPRETRRPNVVFILVDDLGWADIGAFNPRTFYDTPNINRLAAEGMMFTNGYGRVHLYDLETDLGERNDVASDHGARVDDMRKRLHAWYRDVDAKFLSALPDGPAPWQP